MKSIRRNKRSLGAIGLTTSILLMTACSSDNDTAKEADANETAIIDTEDAALQFDSASGQAISVTLSKEDGSDAASLALTAYTVSYTANPIEMAAEYPSYFFTGAESINTLEDVYSYQKMNIYIPENADENTPIIFAVNNGGWATHSVSTSIVDGETYHTDSDSDRIGAALAAGYIFCDVGTRGRGALASDNSWQGKAPAAIVDAKAAIRYLRLNDAAMPGSTDKIVITGTSGGGALSSIVAASGNSADYNTYLSDIGAAGIDSNGESSLRDDVFATIAYCPITDLGNADAAYEWQYGSLREIGDPLSGPAGFLPWINSELSSDMLTASSEVASGYESYITGLGLSYSNSAGQTQALTGESMSDAIIALVTKSVQAALDKQTSVPAFGESFDINGNAFENTWLVHDNSTVTSVDYTAFLTFVKSISNLKGVPSFDVTGTLDVTSVGSGESNLFGSTDTDYSNYTQWAWDNNQVVGDGSGADDTDSSWSAYLSGSDIEEQLKLINPIAYLTSDSEGDSAPYWYVRHGLIDRDTSFAVEATLFNAIENASDVSDANFGLAYIRNHSGNYDVQEAYAWLATALAND